MPIVKFDDIPKVAGSILDDDFQTNGYEFVCKQKTNLSSAVATTTVNHQAEKDVKTPAKISWKIPSPLGIAGFMVDKLEMDKAGKFKLESSFDKSLHKVDGLKVELKSDLENVSKIVGGCTFTGIADTQIKLEAPVTKPDSFTLDLTRNVQHATLGLKCGKANLSAPDIGARVAMGPFFGSLLVKSKFQTITTHAAYTVSPDLKVAATCVKGKSLTGTMGLEYKVKSDTTVKAKVQSSSDPLEDKKDPSISASVKHSLVKGFTLITGSKYNLKAGSFSIGCKLTVE